MGNLVSEICSDIDTVSGDLNELMQRAAYCFENYRGLCSEAWPEDIRMVNVSKEEVDKLKISLENFISQKKEQFYFGTAFWAYGKAATRKDLPFLKNNLEKNLDADANVLYQIMCAIGNVGENIFNGERSSMLDEEKNRSLARRYIEKQL